MVLDNITASFTTGRIGLVGANGTGKSTLLKLINSELKPTSGSINSSGAIGYLPQNLASQRTARVADLCGIGAKLDALRSIESGDVDPQLFETLEECWDVESRALANLSAAGLGGIGLARPVSSLSGGEAITAALVGLRLGDHEISLLDEPTNNLDREARQQLYEAILDWPGTLLVASHDVELLDLMDDIAELRTGSLAKFGGNYDSFRNNIEKEQLAAQRALGAAQQKLKTEKKQRIEAQTKMARRLRYARTEFQNKRKPKVVMNQRKTEAQVSAGKLRTELDDKVLFAQQAVDQRAQLIRTERRIRVELPDPGVPNSRRLAELRDNRGGRILLQGPRRMALTGRNGVGKTRLLESLIHPDTVAEDRPRAIRYAERVGYLPQMLSHLDDNLTVLETVRASAPNAPLEKVRANLARFLFRSDTLDLHIADLSGGERFRVALAQILLADPPNQLLVIDEATNSLDHTSIDELESALTAFRGGLVIVSHDEHYLSRLGIDIWVELTDQGLRLSPDRRSTAL